MYKYDLSFPGNLNLRVEASLPVFESTAARLLVHAYLPGVSFLAQPTSSSKADLTVRYQVASSATIAAQPDFTPSLVVSQETVTLTDLYAGEGSLLDLIHLIYSALRPLWIRLGLYPVHSVCVGDDQRGYTLVVGHSGAGKTAIALALAERSLGASKIFSGNKTLVSFGKKGEIFAVAGTRTMTRARSDGTPSTATGVVGYQERVAFELGDLSVLSQGAADQAVPMPVKLIALARLNDGTAQCQRLSPLSALHRLFPFFLDTVNADTVVCAGQSVYSGALPVATVKKASAALALGTKSVPVIAVAGSMAYVTKALEDNCGGEKA